MPAPPDIDDAVVTVRAPDVAVTVRSLPDDLATTRVLPALDDDDLATREYRAVDPERLPAHVERALVASVVASPPPSVAPPPSARQGAALAAIPGGALFREEAVRAYMRGESGAAVLRVAPAWTSTLLCIASVVGVGAIAAACFARVDLTARAPGILRPLGGTQTLAAQNAGRIAEVRIHPGDRVGAGDALFQFDVAAVKASVLEADKELALAEDNLRDYETRQVPHREAEKRLLASRIALLEARGQSQGATQRRLQARRTRVARLDVEGLSTAAELEDVEEQIASASRTRSTIADEVVQARAQIARIGAEVEAEQHRLRAAVESARAHRDALAFSVGQTEVAAPKAGLVEAVVAQPGDTVAAGAPLVKIVPDDAPLRVVALLAERDRAFVDVGSEVRLEMEQLPAAEFGALHGKVVHVAADLASSYEIRELLGDRADPGGPVYRVDVELVDDGRARSLGHFLRPSSLLTVRFALRTRRLITVLFEPLRKVLT